MVRLGKSIFFLLLIMVLHVAIGSSLAEESFCETPVSMSVSSSQQQSFDNIPMLYLPTAELGSIGLPLQQQFSSRSYRSHFDGFAFTLRDIAGLIAEREAMLFKHWQRVNEEDALSPIIHPISEYYVFALRRIII